MVPAHTVLKILLPLAGALVLAGCGGEPEDRSYEADVVDESGGDLIVTDRSEGVDVELPQTPMTPVPPAGEPVGTPAPEPVPAPE